MTLSVETWLPVVGFEDHYAVSNQGRVMRIKAGRAARTGRVLNPSPNTGGYLTVWLSIAGKRYARMVHLLVAQAFMGPAAGREVNHKDGKKPNCAKDNLEYTTRKGNAQHALAMGLFHPRRGQEAGKSKLTDVDVLNIRNELRSKMRIQDIALLYGVSRGTISCLLRRVYWKHL